MTQHTRADAQNTEATNSVANEGMRDHTSLQEIADIAQNMGMHPDRINAVCDAFTELLEACNKASRHFARKANNNDTLTPNEHAVWFDLSAAIAKAEGRA